MLSDDKFNGIAFEDIRSALEKILASKPLSSSPQASAMLKYLVEEALEGRGPDLKAYTVGVDALGKPVNFDAQADPSVRVLARSLRQALIEYYARDGSQDKVRIDIPTGRYQPTFHLLDPGNANSGREQIKSPRYYVFGIAAICVIVIASLFYAFNLYQPNTGLPVVDKFEGPRVLIQPFAFAKDPPPKKPANELAMGISAELVSDMSRYPWLSVVYLPDESSGLDSLMQMATTANPPHYVLSGRVSENGAHVLVSVTLQSFPALKIKWSSVFKEPFDRPDFEKLHFEISAKIASIVGSENGIVPELLKTNPPPSLPIDVDAFRCFMEIYPYWREPSLGRRAHLQQCLETTVARIPNYAEAWGALASVYIDIAMEETNAGNDSETWSKADSAIAKALEISPLSPVVLKSAMTWSLNKPDRDLAAFEYYARRELELRPNNPDTLAEIGTRLAVNVGKWDTGLELVAQAIDLNPRPPAWYFLASGLLALKQGNDDEMPETLKRANIPSSAPINLIQAIAAASSGETDLLNTRLENLEKLGITDSASARSYISQNRLEPELDRILLKGVDLAYAFPSSDGI